MPGLFINYRRDDQPGYAGRLADALESAFGAEKVFRDIEDIRPGDDFVVALQKQLAGIDVMLVVIGPAWLATRIKGVRRLDEPEDFVRMEIETVLKSGKPLLPVLVSGAAMPIEADLPSNIRALARRQAIVLSDVGWSSDVARLIESIRPFLPPPATPFLATKPALGLGWNRAACAAGYRLERLLAWNTRHTTRSNRTRSDWTLDRPDQLRLGR